MAKRKLVDVSDIGKRDDELGLPEQMPKVPTSNGIQTQGFASPALRIAQQRSQNRQAQPKTAGEVLQQLPGTTGATPTSFESDIVLAHAKKFLGSDMIDLNYGTELNKYMFAEGQSNWQRLGVGAGNIIKTAVTEYAKLPGYLWEAGEALVRGIAPGGMTAEDVLGTMDLNPYLSYFNEMSENLVEDELAMYWRQGVQDGTFLQQLGSPEFWATEAADGVGFLLSFMGPGLTAKGLNGLAKAANVGTKMSRGLGRAVTAIEKVTPGGKVADFSRKLSQTAGKNLPGIGRVGMTTVAESAAEASFATHEMRQQLYDLVEKGLMTKEEADARIGTAGKNIFLSNMSVLWMSNSVLDKFIFGNMLGKSGKRSLARKAYNKTHGLKEKELSKFEKVMNGSLPVLQGIASESAEEGIQFSIENFNRRYAMGELSPTEMAAMDDILEYTSEMWDGYMSAFSSTDGQKAMFLGGLLGGGAATLGQIRKKFQKEQSTAKLEEFMTNNFEQHITTLLNNYKRYEDGPKKGQLMLDPNTNMPVPIRNLDKIRQMQKDNQLQMTYDVAIANGDVAVAQQIEHHHLTQYFMNLAILPEGVELAKQEIDRLADSMTAAINQVYNQNKAQGSQRSADDFKSYWKNKVDQLSAHYDRVTEVGADYFFSKKALKAIEESLPKDIKLSTEQLNELTNEFFERMVMESTQDFSNAMFFKDNMKEIEELLKSLSNDENLSQAERAAQSQIYNEILDTEKKLWEKYRENTGRFYSKGKMRERFKEFVLEKEREKTAQQESVKEVRKRNLHRFLNPTLRAIYDNNIEQDYLEEKNYLVDFSSEFQINLPEPIYNEKGEQIDPLFQITGVKDSDGTYRLNVVTTDKSKRRGYFDNSNNTFVFEDKVYGENEYSIIQQTPAADIMQQSRNLAFLRTVRKRVDATRKDILELERQQEESQKLIDQLMVSLGKAHTNKSGKSLVPVNPGKRERVEMTPTELEEFIAEQEDKPAFKQELVRLQKQLVEQSMDSIMVPKTATVEPVKRLLTVKQIEQAIVKEQAKLDKLVLTNEKLVQTYNEYSEIRKKQGEDMQDFDPHLFARALNSTRKFIGKVKTFITNSTARVKELRKQIEDYKKQLENIWTDFNSYLEANLGPNFDLSNPATLEKARAIVEQPMILNITDNQLNALKQVFDNMESAMKQLGMAEIELRNAKIKNKQYSNVAKFDKTTLTEFNALYAKLGRAYPIEDEETAAAKDEDEDLNNEQSFLASKEVKSVEELQDKAESAILEFSENERGEPTNTTPFYDVFSFAKTMANQLKVADYQNDDSRISEGAKDLGVWYNFVYSWSPITKSYFKIHNFHNLPASLENDVRFFSPSLSKNLDGKSVRLTKYEILNTEDTKLRNTLIAEAENDLKYVAYRLQGDSMADTDLPARHNSDKKGRAIYASVGTEELKVGFGNVRYSRFTYDQFANRYAAAQLEKLGRKKINTKAKADYIQKHSTEIEQALNKELDAASKQWKEWREEWKKPEAAPKVLTVKDRNAGIKKDLILDDEGNPQRIQFIGGLVETEQDLEQHTYYESAKKIRRFRLPTKRVNRAVRFGERAFETVFNKRIPVYNGGLYYSSANRLELIKSKALSTEDAEKMARVILYHIKNPSDKQSKQYINSVIQWGKPKGTKTGDYTIFYDYKKEELIIGSRRATPILKEDLIRDEAEYQVLVDFLKRKYHNVDNAEFKNWENGKDYTEFDVVNGKLVEVEQWPASKGGYMNYLLNNHGRRKGQSKMDGVAMRPTVGYDNVFERMINYPYTNSSLNLTDKVPSIKNKSTTKKGKDTGPKKKRQTKSDAVSDSLIGGHFNPERHYKLVGEITGEVKGSINKIIEAVVQKDVTFYVNDDATISGIVGTDLNEKQTTFLSKLFNTALKTETGLNDMLGTLENSNIKISFEEVDAPQDTGDTGGTPDPINIWAGTNENAHLSNFANRPFEIGGVTFPTVEHAFQATKALAESDKITTSQRIANEKIVEKIRVAKTPAQAKKLGRTLKGLDIEEWDKGSAQIMKELIKQSFIQNPDALQKLLDTGNAELTHTQDKGKWGTEFPRILMEVRSELSTATPSGRGGRRGRRGRQTGVANRMANLAPNDYVRMSHESALEYMQEKFPGIDVQVVQEALIDGYSMGRVLYNGAVMLANTAEEGTEYHEAWHVFSQFFVAPAEREKLYKEVIDGGYAKDRRGAEEYLAERFRLYKLDPSKFRGKQTEKSVFERILTYLKQMFFDFFGMELEEIEEVPELVMSYFQNFDAGTYRMSEAKYKPLFKLLDRAIGGLTSAEVREILKDFNYNFFYELLDATDYDGDTARKLFIGYNTQVNLVDVYNSVFDFYKENPDNNPLINKVNNLSDEEKTALREMHGRMLTQYGIDSAVFTSEVTRLEQYLEVTSPEIFEETADDSVNQDDYIDGTTTAEQLKEEGTTSVKSLVPVPVRLLIASTTEADFSATGLNASIDFNTTHNILLNTLKGVRSIYEMYDRLWGLYESDKNKYNFAREILEIINPTYVDDSSELMTASEIDISTMLFRTYSRQQTNPVMYMVSSRQKEGGNDIYLASAISDHQETAILNQWKYNLVLGARAMNSNTYTVRDKKTGAYMIDMKTQRTVGESELSLLQAFERSLGFDEQLDVLRNLGIDLDATLFSDESFDQTEVTNMVNDAYNGIASELRKRYRDAGTTVDDFFNREEFWVGPELRTLARFVGRNQIDTKEQSFRAPSGTIKYSITTPHYLSLLSEAFKDDLTEDESDLVANLAPWTPTNPTGNKNTVNSLWYEFRNNEEFELVQIEGLKYEIGDGKEISSASEIDLVATQFMLIFDNIMPILRAGDRKGELGFKLPEQNFTKTNRQDDFVEAMTGYLVDELHTTMDLRVNGKGKELVNFSKNAWDLRIMKGIVGNVMTTDKLFELEQDLRELPQDEHYDKINDFVKSHNALLRKAFVNYYGNQMANNFKKLLDQNALIEVDGGYKFNGISKDTISKVLNITDPDAALSKVDVLKVINVFTYYWTIGSIEQLKLITGDIGTFKSFTEVNKRTKGLSSTKENSAFDEEYNRHLENVLTRMDGKPLDGNMKIVHVQDVNTTVQDSTRQAIQDSIANNSEVFDDMDEADGSTILSFDSYMEFLHRSGYSNPQVRMLNDVIWQMYLIQRKSHPRVQKYAMQFWDKYGHHYPDGMMKSRLKLPAEAYYEGKPVDVYQLADSVPAIKPLIYGPIRNSIGELMHANMYGKTALFPIIPTAIVNTKLEELMWDMMDSQTDALMMDSANKQDKIGRVTELTVEQREAVASNPDNDYQAFHEVPAFSSQLPTLYNADGSYGLNLSEEPVTLVSYESIGAQEIIKTENERGSKITSSTQQQALIHFNLFGIDKATAANNESFNEFHAIRSSIAKSERLNTLRKLGIEQRADNEFFISKPEKFLKEIERVVTNRDLPMHIRDGLYAVFNNAKHGVYLFDSFHDKQTIEYMLSSIVRSNMIKFKVKGGMYVQEPSTLWETGNRERNGSGKLLANSTLRYYEKDENGVSRAEVMLALPKEFLPILKHRYNGDLDRLNADLRTRRSPISEELLNLVANRVPADDMHSVEIFTIKKFLPPYYGKRIIVPTEIVAKAGSDYDIDKLFTYFRNSHTVNGQVVPMKYYKNPSMGELKDMYNQNYGRTLKKAEVIRNQLFENGILNASLLSQTNIFQMGSGQDQELFAQWLIEGDILDNTGMLTREEVEQIMQDAREVPSFDEFAGRWATGEDVNSRGAKENRLLDIQEEILLDPDNYKYLMQPISTSNIKQLAEELVTSQEFEQSGQSESTSWSRVTEWAHNFDLSKAFWLGRKVIGMAAVSIVHHARTQYTPIRLNSLAKVFLKEVGQGDLRIGFVEDADGNTISHFFSEILNAYIDLTKDRSITLLNINTTTYNVLNFLARTGDVAPASAKTVAAFLRQPIIKEYIKRVNTENGITIEGFTGPKQIAKAMLMDDNAMYLLYDKLDLETNPLIKQSLELQIEELAENRHNFTQEELVDMSTKSYDNLTAVEKEYQLQILDDYLTYDFFGKKLAFDVQGPFRLDAASSLSKSRAIQKSRRNKRENVLNSRLSEFMLFNSEDVNRSVSDTFIGELMNSHNMGIDMFNSMFLFDNVYVKEQLGLEPEVDLWSIIADTVASQLPPNTYGGEREAIFQKLDSALINSILHTQPIKGVQLNKRYKQLLAMNEDSFIKKLATYLSKNAKSVEKHPFLKAIVPELYRINRFTRLPNDFAFIRQSAKALHSFDSDAITEDLKSMFELSPVSPLHEQARLIMETQLLQAGVSNGYNSINQVLPSDLMQPLIYERLLSWMFSTADKFDIDTFVTEFFANNLGNTNMMSFMPNKNKAGNGMYTINKNGEMETTRWTWAYNSGQGEVLHKIRPWLFTSEYSKATDTRLPKLWKFIDRYQDGDGDWIDRYEQIGIRGIPNVFQEWYLSLSTSSVIPDNRTPQQIKAKSVGTSLKSSMKKSDGITVAAPKAFFSTREVFEKRQDHVTAELKKLSSHRTKNRTELFKELDLQMPARDIMETELANFEKRYPQFSYLKPDVRRDFIILVHNGRINLDKCGI